MWTAVQMCSVRCWRAHPLTLDLRMLNDEDFQVWRKELRRFLHSWSVDPLGSQISSNRTMERADKLLQTSLEKLEPVASSKKSSQLSQVVDTLKQLQQEHMHVRQALVHSDANSPLSTTNSSVPPPVPLKTVPPIEPSTMQARDGTTSGVAADTMNGAAASSHLASPSQMHEDNDFYDAIEEVDGIEFEINANYGLDEEEEESPRRDDHDDSDDEEARNMSLQASNVALQSQGPVEAPTPQHRDPVQYRKELPVPVTGEEMSLFSILKKNVGKDLSTISFPVTFNCPLSLLQAVAEEYEYAPDVLERAAVATDPKERMCLVGAFAVSSYASTAQRSSRKPFNPLLGETFECVRADRDMIFVAEKVVHRPPVIASFAKGKGWSVSAAGTMKNKFWGKSLELIAVGAQVVELDSGDKYSITKPSSYMRNLLAGNKYLEHVGELFVTNLRTQERLVIQFKESPMFGGAAARNHIQGTMFDTSDHACADIKGKWDESVSRLGPDGKTDILWQAVSMPPNSNKYYGFTYFALSLNEITPDIENVLPPTDSRLRPDQRALEDGDAEAAEELKHALEQNQRERRKMMEESGETYSPQWFHAGNYEGVEWVYGAPDGRDYFQEREKVANTGSLWNTENVDIFKS